MSKNENTPPQSEQAPLDGVQDPLAPEPIEIAEGSAEEFDTPLEVVKLEEENATLKDQLLRAIAEAENARRRAQKDREDASKFAINSFARDLLPVADNLRRALSAVPEELLGLDPRVQNLMDGIEATERELLKGLQRHGVEPIEAEGKLFDPNLHEVMFEMPAGDKPAGTVLQVMEAGYTLKGRILRPARVGVASGEANPPHSVDTQA